MGGVITVHTPEYVRLLHTAIKLLLIQNNVKISEHAIELMSHLEMGKGIILHHDKLPFFSRKSIDWFGTISCE